MEVYSLIVRNQELFRLVYTLLIGIACFAIVVRTNRLFRLSFHQGIRYFRNAFFFYGLAFLIRYPLGESYFLIYKIIPSFITKALFEFFLIMGGFSLLYSLLWKKLETEKGSLSSLFNAKIALFYALALVIVGLDYLWKTYYLMFASQIILFGYASTISYLIYIKSENQQNFLKLYLVVMILNLIAWLSNFVVAVFFNWHQGGIISIHILNVIIFLLFLYSVVKATK